MSLGEAAVTLKDNVMTLEEAVVTLEDYVLTVDKNGDDSEVG